MLPPVQLLYVGSTAMMFKGTQLSEVKSTGEARHLIVTDHEYSHIEVRKSPQMYGTCRESYIVEGSTTSYDSSS